MRFFWIKIIILNFIICNAFAQIEQIDVQTQNLLSCSLYKSKAMLEENEDYIRQLGEWYARGERRTQDYNESLKFYQALSLRKAIPMYSLDPAFLLSDTASTKQLINKHNGLFVKEVFEFEDSMINFLSLYSNVLAQNFSSRTKRQKEGSDDIKFMLNNNGSASRDYCPLDFPHQILLLLYIHPPTRGNVTVIDI